MFISYLQNTLYLLLIVLALFLLFPRLRAYTINGLAKTVLKTYFEKGIWLKRVDLNNGEKEDFIHLMYLGGEGFVITRTSMKGDPLGAELYTKSSNPREKVAQKIIIPD